MIGKLLPAEVAYAEIGSEEVGALFVEEKLIVAKAVPKRRAEFFAGRECARQALRGFGVPAKPIGQIDGRGPRWPDGFVGSITHCDGYRAAAVARAGDFVAIGIDAEPNEPLPESVLDLISSSNERASLMRLNESNPETHWDRLLFSVKESVYKAWSPMTGEWLGFEEVEIDIDQGTSSFRARFLRQPSTFGGISTSDLAGRWRSTNGLLLTAVVIRR